MAVPPSGSPCWLRLANGEVSGFSTEHIALKFLLKRLKSDSIPATNKARELYEFFLKYERLLDKEINALNFVKARITA